MSEIEKLRSLLEEARDWILSVGGNDDDFLDRIYAALEEPVQDYEALYRTNVRCECGDYDACLLTRQRDEARAEVERLRSLKPIGTYSLDWNHEQERQNTARAAYQRGAEAMREAAIRVCEEPQMGTEAETIRALPIPEDK